jgi:hypothetical protein
MTNSYFIRSSLRGGPLLGARDAGVSDHVLHGEAMPNDEDNDGANRSTHESRALIGPIPANALSDPSPSSGRDSAGWPDCNFDMALADNRLHWRYRN